MLEHKTVSLAEQVFDHLESDILSGKYKRGEVITEIRLSTELGVSRTPVREALRRLIQEHIIEETSKGIVVVGINRKDVEEIFTIRTRIEGLASAETARNISAEHLEKLREVLELQEFYVEKHDADHIKEMDSKFHSMIYRYSNSATYYDTLLPLHKKVQKYRKVSVEDKTRADDSLAEHRGIFNAIAAHDAALAEKLTIDHITNARDKILSCGIN